LFPGEFDTPATGRRFFLCEANGGPHAQLRYRPHMPSSSDPAALPGVAGATGRYREWTPPATLHGDFGQLWRSDLPMGHSAEVAVLPDGCVDLLWRDGRLYVVGPDVVAAHPQLTPGAQVLGARFQPGAARAWLGLPLSEIVGTAVELDALLGVRARRMAARLNAVGDADARQRLFARELALLPRSARAPHPTAAAVFARVRGGGTDLSALATTLQLSTRSLRRLCHEQFGYGPKMLERILRLQRLLALARARPRDGLAMLALEGGYADQSHLSREVRALTGIGAAALCAQWRD
jgi:AraC-like DNA-binding protein